MWLFLSPGGYYYLRVVMSILGGYYDLTVVPTFARWQLATTVWVATYVSQEFLPPLSPLQVP